MDENHTDLFVPLIHRVYFGQFKLSTDVEKNPEPSFYVDATKTIHAPYCQGNGLL